jgi:hypothetical protein
MALIPLDPAEVDFQGRVILLKQTIDFHTGQIETSWKDLSRILDLHEAGNEPNNWASLARAAIEKIESSVATRKDARQDLQDLRATRP